MKTLMILLFSFSTIGLLNAQHYEDDSYETREGYEEDYQEQQEDRGAYGHEDPQYEEPAYEEPGSYREHEPRQDERDYQQRREYERYPEEEDYDDGPRDDRSERPMEKEDYHVNPSDSPANYPDSDTQEGYDDEQGGY